MSSFPCSSKSLLKFRLSSTRLLIKWFLIKKRVQVEGQTIYETSNKKEKINKELFNVDYFITKNVLNGIV